MLEKRRTVRYCLGNDSDIAIQRDGAELPASLVDVSTTGLMAEVSDAAFRDFQPGLEVCGRLRNAGAVVPWRGTVVHRSPVRHGLGIGIAFASGSAATDALREIVRQPEAGGIQLRGSAGGLSLDVIGRLSFPASRRGLLYSRLNVISSIDLSRCHSIDSAGIGMLCIARGRNITILGAQGEVRRLLDLAGIPVVDSAPVSGRQGASARPY